MCESSTGVPCRSTNCLLAAGLPALAVGGDAMRVPNPAAGMITTIFMRANSIRVAASTVQISACNRSCTFSNKNMSRMILVTTYLEVR